MKVKRIVASVGASFEQFVNKVENHEAVADVAIRDVRASAAKLKVQLGRINAEVDRLRERRDTLVADSARWRERAKQFATKDEERALACLGRMERTTTEAGRMADQLSRHEALADKLKDRLAAVEAQLSDLQLKRTALSSRSARAQVMGTANQEATAEAQDVFARWETAVVEDEYLEGVVLDESDPLERELDAADAKKRLQLALEELKRED